MLLKTTTDGLFAVRHLRYTRWWLWFGFFLIVVVLLFSVLNPPRVVTSLADDKVMHFLSYAGLMGWFSQIFRHPLTRILLVILFIAFGVSIEFLQSMVPHRQFELFDMLANASGVVLAWVLGFTAFGAILERFEKHCLLRAWSTV